MSQKYEKGEIASLLQDVIERDYEIPPGNRTRVFCLLVRCSYQANWTSGIGVEDIIWNTHRQMGLSLTLYYKYTK